MSFKLSTEGVAMAGQEKARLTNAAGVPEGERGQGNGLAWAPQFRTSLTLPIPPSANAYWVAARGRVFPSKEALAYKRAVAALARGVLPFRGPVRVLVFVHSGTRTGDLDNCLKVLFDALNGVAWIDDSQVDAIDARRSEFVHESPSVLVEVDGAERATAAELAAHKQAKADANRKRKATLRKNRAARRLASSPKSPKAKRLEPTPTSGVTSEENHLPVSAKL